MNTVITDEELKSLWLDGEEETPFDPFAPELLFSKRWQIARFLSALFSPYEKGFVELRAIGGGGKPLRFWIHLPDLFSEKRRETLESVCAWVFAREREHKDIYCGVLPRGRQGGKKADVYEAAVIWGDLDFKLEGGSDAALCAVEEHDPDIVVLSGNGVHAYWFMPEKVTLDNAALLRFQGYVKKKQQEILPGSDPVQDVTRILRLPGSCNWKNPDGVHPVLLARARRKDK